MVILTTIFSKIIFNYKHNYTLLYMSNQEQNNHVLKLKRNKNIFGNKETALTKIKEQLNNAEHGDVCITSFNNNGVENIYLGVKGHQENYQIFEGVTLDGDNNLKVSDTVQQAITDALNGFSPDNPVVGVTDVTKEGDVFTVTKTGVGSTTLKLNYASKFSDSTKQTANDVGGIAKGTQLNELTQLTFSEIFDKILFTPSNNSGDDDNSKITDLINSIKIIEVSDGLGIDVAKRYQLIGINNTPLGVSIDIPVASGGNSVSSNFIKSAKLGKAIPSTGAGDSNSTTTEQDCLILEIATDESTSKTINIPLGSFLRESEFKDGLKVSANGEVSVKIDSSNSMTNLKVDDSGLKFEQLQADQISFQSNSVDGLESTDVQSVIQELLGTITTEKTTNGTSLQKIRQVLGVGDDYTLNFTESNNLTTSSTVSDALLKLDTLLNNFDEIDCIDCGNY